MGRRPSTTRLNDMHATIHTSFCHEGIASKKSRKASMRFKIQAPSPCGLICVHGWSMEGGSDRRRRGGFFRGTVCGATSPFRASCALRKDGQTLIEGQNLWRRTMQRHPPLLLPFRPVQTLPPRWQAAEKGAGDVSGVRHGGVVRVPGCGPQNRVGRPHVPHHRLVPNHH